MKYETAMSMHSTPYAEIIRSVLGAHVLTNLGLHTIRVSHPLTDMNE